MTIAEKSNHDFKNGGLSLYDSNGNGTYYKDSTGFWWKCEYDSDGNEIYFEDSTGYIEDNRPTT